MAKRFDQILDECINRILLYNETVEDCLARYPRYAAELSPHLLLVGRAARAYAFIPSPAAKERGRRRLQEALQEPEEKAGQPAVGQKPRRWLGALWQPRWAMAVATLVLVLVMGGVGTAAASNGALPGERLYPVKRAIEQVRLALQTSQTGKAKLHLAFAERRAQEISVLVRKGDAGRLGSAARNLRENLTAVAQVTSDALDERTIEGLKSQLDASASQVLARLQSALQEAPETAKQMATESLQASSDAYGNAVETVTSRSQDRYVNASPGVLQFWAADPPPPDAEKVLVEVGKIEAYLAAGPNSQWVTITLEPQTFDLLRIAEMQRFLGEQTVKPGTYTRVRFQINKATVVAGGVQHPAQVPNESLSLTRPFRVEEHQTTVVLLDFDGAHSLQITGQGEPLIAPEVRLFTQEPKPKEQLVRESRPAPQKTPEKPGTGPAPPAQPTFSLPLVRGTGGKVKVELEGTIEQLSLDSLVVRGRRITIPPGTQNGPAPKTGQTVKIEAAVQPDGSLVAIKIEMGSQPKPDSRRGDEEEEEEREERGDSSRGIDVRFTDNIEFVSLARWIVGGQEVLIGKDTRIEGRPAVGFKAQVEGARNQGGKVLAVSIKLVGGQASPGTGTNQGTKQPPTPTPTKTKNETPRRIQITGELTDFRLDGWEVEGQAVVLTDQTVIEGSPVKGAIVEVEGIQQANGTITVVKIRVLSRPREDKQTEPAPTPALPLPVSTPEAVPPATPVPVPPGPTPAPTHIPLPTSTPKLSTPRPEPTPTPPPTATPSLSTPAPGLTPFPTPTPVARLIPVVHEDSRAPVSLRPGGQPSRL